MMARSSTHPHVHNRETMELISRHYSQQLLSCIDYCLRETSRAARSIDELFGLIGSRALDEIDQAHMAFDHHEAQLEAELENGRLFRLMTKLGFINERPEYAFPCVRQHTNSLDIQI